MNNKYNKALKMAALIFFLSQLFQTAFAADPANGKALHNESCLACHTSLTNGQPDSLYTRKNRKFNSLDALNKQVMRCQNSVGANWFDDQIADVVQYLNNNFYHVK